jgi:bifunctional DNA-binding transcriptional regulator/antitoxin component of YhaV-PrlF toxin-antitoxin module
VLSIKLSSKRQATFPKKVCESLGVEPGDELILDRRLEEDQEVWVLSPAKEVQRPWLGCLQAYATGKEHDMSKIRESIARGRGSPEA